MFLNATERDKFLSETVGINIASYHKIKDSKLLYGSDINFKYDNKNFQWGRDDFIYLMSDSDAYHYLIKDNSKDEKTERYFCFNAKNLTKEQIVENLYKLKSDYEIISFNAIP